MNKINITIKNERLFWIINSIFEKMDKIPHVEYGYVAYLSIRKGVTTIWYKKTREINVSCFFKD